MAYMLQRFGNICRGFRNFHSAALSRRKLSTFCTTSVHQQLARGDNAKEFKDNLRRCSNLSVINNGLVAHVETLNFIKSLLDEIEGPTHYWLNYLDKNDLFINQDGIFLVIVNACFGDATSIGYRENVILFEKIKLLQQRYPKLNIIGLECGGLTMSVAKQAQIIQTVMEEYITFPILISDKSFTGWTNGACCLLFEGSTNHLLHQELDLELDGIVKLIKEYDFSIEDVPQKDEIDLFMCSNGDNLRQHEGIKEPQASSAFKHLLLYCPGCVSVDEDGNRLFVSDSNHYRIIITDGDGKILDCIGSSPGFEDGEFESAKLLHPAASFYDVAENCLYFVDSMNNAIRRADMEGRVLETMFPAPVSKTSVVWGWILDKLGVQNILQNCGNIIAEKTNLLGDAYGNSLPHQLYNKNFVERIPYVGLISSVADFHGYTIFCDAAAHRVLKCHRESRTVSDIEFSNFRALRFPHWLLCQLETVSNRNLRRPWTEHLHNFSVLPGRCEIRVKVELPKGVELVEPLGEECIWRQARGSIAELSGSDEVAATAEKVGVAQQWFDELDNLAFSKEGNESCPEVEEQVVDGILQDKHKAQFDCAVNISPGTGEVVVSAVLYVKLTETEDSEEQLTKATKILNLENHGQRNPSEEACISLLLENVSELEDLIFTKPLHLRIRLDCVDHPTAATRNETILTDTSLEINMTLD